MARIDHTNCTHPRTPAGRRACRAGGATPPPADDNRYIRDHIRKAVLSKNLTARMDHDARKIKACPQAELHTFPGRCACGWHTEGF